MLPTWIIGMRLHTVYDMSVTFQQHRQFTSVPVPDEYVTAIRPTHYIVFSPEISFFYLKTQVLRQKSRLHCVGLNIQGIV